MYLPITIFLIILDYKLSIKLDLQWRVRFFFFGYSSDIRHPFSILNFKGGICLQIGYI